MAKKAKKKEKAAEKPKPARAAKVKGRTEPVYSVMAFVTLVAMILGCVLLYLDFDEYGKQNPPKDNPPALPKLGGDDAKAP